MQQKYVHKMIMFKKHVKAAASGYKKKQIQDYTYSL